VFTARYELGLQITQIHFRHNRADVNGSISVNAIYRVHSYSDDKCLWLLRITVTLDIFGQSLLPSGCSLSEGNSHKKKQCFAGSMLTFKNRASYI
jgi:hypothetical protein